MLLPVAQYRPDQPSLIDGGSDAITNVLAKTANSYGPVPSLAVYSGALGARAQGAIGVSDSAGNAYAFAGTASKLYRAASGSTAWSDVSKAAGYSTGGQERWSSTFFTPNRVLMTNFADPIQSYVLGSSTLFADLSSGAPKARYLATVRDFVVAANTFDSTDGNRPTRVWWCAIGDPTNWPTPGTSAAAQVQSDFQDINLGDWGWIQGLCGGLGQADACIFFERGIARMVYEGAGTIFGIYPVEAARGTPAPGSIAQLGAFAFYLGEDDLYMLDGAQSVPLGAEAFAKTLYSDIDQSHFDRITSAVDPITKNYFLAYPAADNVGGNPNRVLAYNWLLKRATLIDALGDIEVLFRSLSFGYTLDGLDAVSSSIETLPFDLDSRAWTGGRPLLSAINGAHKLCYFTGASLAPTVDTSEMQLVPGKRAQVNYVRPLTDGGTPSVAMLTRERQQDAAAVGPAVAMNVLGTCPQRASARYHAARLTYAAGDTSWTEIAGVDLPGADEDADDPAYLPDGGR